MYGSRRRPGIAFVNIQRLTPSPVITTATHRDAGDNINGPSLIKAPPWIRHPLGRYYLYFAHHNGRFIRLAYADELNGPWKLRSGGVLPLRSSGFRGHLASPDVHVDETREKVLMYFHGSDSETDALSPQFTRLAESSDGLNFDVRTGNLGGAYWRVFSLGDYFYTLEMPGLIRRSLHAHGPFEPGPTLFTDRMRHSAVSIRGPVLDVFYSNVGDCPESIIHSTIDIGASWESWTASGGQVVAVPQSDAEGEHCDAVPSKRGIAVQPVRQLRDPAIYEYDGIRYLLFSVAGEQGIAIARLD